jgi:chemotaxis signal transduction protein
MTRGAGYLLVRAGERRVGLPISQVVEVVQPGRTYPVPSVGPAVRGVATIRGRILPVVHLGAFLDGGSCPAVPSETGVILVLDGHHICLEVEAADLIVQEPGLPVDPGSVLPWAVAVAHYAGGLVPLLDLSALAGSLATAMALAPVSPPASRCPEVRSP